MPESKRVCITGVGAVSPFGRDASSLWTGLSAGRSAVARIGSFDANALACRIAAEVREYKARDDIDPEAAAMMDRRTQFAADAAIQALADAAKPDGIRGRAAIVRDPASGVQRVGRFGWKAGVPSMC